MASSSTMGAPPPPPPPLRHVRAASERTRAPTVTSKYFMNDIPRGTTVPRLMNSLLTPRHMSPVASMDRTPDVFCGIIITDSRLDDELSVATVDFSDTPQWLQDLNSDPLGFPKSTTYGTLWRGVDRSATDSDGRTPFMNAVINASTNSGMLYVEMLAEFSDTDVDVQDAQGRTALHWACINNSPNIVALCLSIPDCTVGLKDNDGFTAFDLALQMANETIPELFYKSIFELEHTQPDAALLRILTVNSEQATDRPLFPGEAIFNPILDRNGPLVKALVDRGIDLTVTNPDGQTALHLATGVGDVPVMEMLLEAGSDVNAVGMAGATPLHCAAQSGQLDVAQLLLDYGADVEAKDVSGETALQYAEQHQAADIAALLKADEENQEAGLQIAWMAPLEPVQPGIPDAIVTDKASGWFGSELAASCRIPMATAQWVGEVDRELLNMISATVDRINTLPGMRWNDLISELNKNDAIESVGNPRSKTELFFIYRSMEASHHLIAPLRKFIRDDDIFQTLQICELSSDENYSQNFEFHKHIMMGRTFLLRNVRWCQRDGLPGDSITFLLRYPNGVKPYFMLFRVELDVEWDPALLNRRKISKHIVTATLKRLRYRPSSEVMSRLMRMQPAAPKPLEKLFKTIRDLGSSG